VRLGDDLKGPPEFRRGAAERLFELLQALAEDLLFLAQVLDAFGAGAGP